MCDYESTRKRSRAILALIPLHAEMPPSRSRLGHEEPLLGKTPPGRIGALRDFRLTFTHYVDRIDFPTKVITCIVDDLLAVGRVVRIVAPLHHFGLASPSGADRVDSAVFFAEGREDDPPTVRGVVGGVVVGGVVG